MEHEKPSIKPIAYTYGLYSALLSIAGLVILYVLNLESHWILSVVSTIVTIFIFYYGISTYKKQNANILSIKDSLKTGMGISLIGGLISAIYAAIHYGVIQPEFLEGKKEEAIDQMMSQNPNMEGEGLEMALKMIDLSTSEFFIGTMMLLGSLFFGFIISLIIGAIIKSN
jgi:preprotein translocase subunit YajC